MNMEVANMQKNNKKWRSVAVSVELYKVLKERADKNDRSVSGELAHIIKNADQQAAYQQHHLVHDRHLLIQLLHHRQAGPTQEHSRWGDTPGV